MKILIVDDDLFFRKFYSTKLKEAGYEVDTAGDGNEGLLKMQQFQPNLVLLDMIMPEKDGFDVLGIISQNEVLKKIPIIIFSTLGDTDDVQKGLSLGAVDYINKSFHDIDNLKQKISSHLQSTS
jgi:DNA-binding response OmpR family regulator